jgi:hypothetical protein
MQDAIDEIGGNGFLIAGYLTPSNVRPVVEDLVPEPRKRQLTRSEYGHAHVRDNSMAFRSRPASPAPRSPSRPPPIGRPGHAVLRQGPPICEPVTETP